MVGQHAKLLPEKRLGGGQAGPTWYWFQIDQGLSLSKVACDRRLY